MPMPEEPVGTEFEFGGRPWRWDGSTWVPVDHGGSDEVEVDVRRRNRVEIQPGPAVVAVEPQSHAPKSSGPETGGGVGEQLSRLPIATLFPLRAWIEEKPWGRPAGLAFTAFAMGPLVLLAVRPSINGASWAISLYFAAVWFLVFQRLIQPDHVPVRIWSRVAAASAVLGVAVAASVEHQLHFGASLFGTTVGIGLPEELVKIAPVLAVAFLGRYWATPLTYLFIGAVSGLAFGVAEAVVYSTGATVAGYASVDQSG